MRPLSPAFSAMLALAIPVVGASAQSVTQVTSSFSNSIPASNTTINNSNPDLIQVCWPNGVSAGCADLGTATDLSGYTFARASTPFDPTIGTPFSLGTFTHHNFVVSLDAPGPLTSVDLLFSFDIGGANPGSFGDSWTLTHDETPNSGTCPYPGGAKCADRVSFAVTGGGGPTQFEFNGANYIIALFGFGQTAEEAALNPDFITFENQANETQLWARITEVPPTSTVPEPATMTLLATGLAGMAAARRKRRNA